VIDFCRFREPHRVVGTNGCAGIVSDHVYDPRNIIPQTADVDSERSEVIVDFEIFHDPDHLAVYHDSELQVRGQRQFYVNLFLIFRIHFIEIYHAGSPPFDS
jgi:hypothetical protein